MAEVRTARSVWTGSVTEGGGKVTAVTSGTFTDLDVTLPTRSGAAEGNTSPEELIAAAHASCYSMALSAGLTRAGTPPDSLDVSASVTFDMGRWRSDCNYQRAQRQSGSVPGVTADRVRRSRRDCQEWLPNLTRPGGRRDKPRISVVGLMP